MSYYNIVRLVFNCLSVAIPCYLVLFKYKNMIYNLFVVFLCFACTFSYDFELFGVVNLQQMSLVLITLFGMGKIDRRDLREDKLCSNVFGYLIYIAFVTIIFYLIKSDYILVGSIIQNQLRPYVQIAFEFFSFMSLLVLTTLDGETSKKILIVFYKTLLFMAILGIAQTLIYSVTSFDILPMRKDFVSSTHGLSAVASNGLLRATAGVGEPKQLAKFMNIGMAMQLLSHKLLGYEKIKISHIVIFGLGIMFTSATTGYIIALAVFGFFCLKNGSKNKSLWPIFIILIIVAAVLVFDSEVVTNKLDRAEASGDIVGLENTDSAAVRWLMAEPYFAFLGVGLSNTVAYANQYARSFDHFINFYPYTLRRDIVYQIAETGIIGTLLFMGIVGILYRTCKYNDELKFLFLFLIFMYMFLTKEAVILIQVFMMALLSNCGDSELRKNELLYRRII